MTRFLSQSAAAMAAILIVSASFMAMFNGASARAHDAVVEIA